MHVIFYVQFLSPVKVIENEVEFLRFCLKYRLKSETKQEDFTTNSFSFFDVFGSFRKLHYGTILHPSKVVN